MDRALPAVSPRIREHLLKARQHLRHGFRPETSQPFGQPVRVHGSEPVDRDEPPLGGESDMERATGRRDRT